MRWTFEGRISQLATSKVSGKRDTALEINIIDKRVGEKEGQLFDEIRNLVMRESRNQIGR